MKPNPMSAMTGPQGFATYLSNMKSRKKSDLPQKTCITCGRPFTWRKKWEKVWEEVKYCSRRCRDTRSKS